MKAVMVIAVAALDEDRRVRQTLRVDLPANVVQMHAFTYVTPRVLYCRVPIHVAELAQAEPVAVVRGIREAVHDDGVGVTVENLTDSTVEFVVRNRGPIQRLLVGHRGYFPRWLGVIRRRGIRWWWRVRELRAR